MSGKKVTTSVIAIVMALAIALSGTFAWQSISQTALNEAMGANPGGRLHDDFSGPGGTKDIYVENFGSLPIYARVRLDEYMEIGPGAGTKDGTTGNSTAASLVTGADIDDVTTWTTHIPGASSADTGAGTESPTWATAGETFHKYWVWTMGGQDTANNPNGTTIYMPTFNKNQDSLHADINGTLEGTIAGDAVHYDDYTAYTNGQQVTADAYYDADNNTTDEDPTKPGNGGTQGTNYTVVNETHTAKSTEAGKVITMAEWKALADTDPGNGTEWKGSVQAWVYDTDGWAYWSQPIAPNTATGLLLDKIAQTNAAINGEWYYAINAVGQFITADDLGSAANADGFYSNGGAAPSSDALTLLETIGVNTSGSTPASGVSIMEGSAVVTRLSMAPSDTKTLTVNAPAGADTNWTWAVATDNSNGHITVNNGTVSVDTSAQAGESAVITATNGDSPALTASVTVTVATTPPAVTYTATIQKNGTATTAEDVTIGDTTGVTLTAAVTASGGSPTASSWTWSVDATNAAKVSLSSTNTASTTVTITSGSGATDGAQTTLTATDAANGNAVANVTITAKAAARTVAKNDVVTLDSIDFVVLDVDTTNNTALLLAKDILEEQGFDSVNHGNGHSTYGDNEWNQSQLRNYLNSDAASGVTLSNGQSGATKTVAGWLNNKNEIATAVVSTDIYTQGEYNSTSMTKTTDKIFLLSQADVFGTYYDGSTDVAVTDNQMYTWKSAKLDLTGITELNQSWIGYTSGTITADWWWLRSPRYGDYTVARVYSDGTLSFSAGCNTPGGVRPALVVNINNLPSV